MRRFQLIGTLGRNKRIHSFEAENDRDALGVAAWRVMSLAYPNREPWANGRIELVNEMGVVLAEMGEKTKTEHTECDHCGRDVDSSADLEWSQSIGWLCAECMENRVWK